MATELDATGLAFARKRLGVETVEALGAAVGKPCVYEGVDWTDFFNNSGKVPLTWRFDKNNKQLPPDPQVPAGLQWSVKTTHDGLKTTVYVWSTDDTDSETLKIACQSSTFNAVPDSVRQDVQERLERFKMIIRDNYPNHAADMTFTFKTTECSVIKLLSTALNRYLKTPVRWTMTRADLQTRVNNYVTSYAVKKSWASQVRRMKASQRSEAEITASRVAFETRVNKEAHKKVYTSLVHGEIVVFNAQRNYYKANAAAESYDTNQDDEDDEDDEDDDDEDEDSVGHVGPSESDEDDDELD